jgi:hypothetical protein
MHGTKYCPLHTPGIASKLGQRGGRRRAVFNPEALEPLPPPKDAGDLLRLALQTLVEVRAAKIEVNVANCILYGIKVASDALELSDLDARLRALEQRDGTATRVQ